MVFRRQIGQTRQFRKKRTLEQKSWTTILWCCEYIASGFTLLQVAIAVQTIDHLVKFFANVDVNRARFNITDQQLATTFSQSSSLGYVLLTGATGLVGQYLLKDLFLRQQKLAVLVRPSRKFSAVERVEVIMQRWERELNRSLPRPIVLEGNLDSETFQLSSEDQNWVAENCDQIIHNAAVLKFECSDLGGEPWKTNFTGTKNAIEFATRSGIDKFHYVSTAYVSGIRDVFKESDFDCGQEFRNEYERSKFEAEKLVRQCDQFSSTTIFRPAVIVGDSTNGYTASYHGLHVYLRLMATLIPQQQPDENGTRHTPIKMNVEADQPRNLVPVDWVSRVISEVVCRDQAHGKTYHLVPDHGPTHRELLDHCYEYFNSDGVQFSGAANDQSGKYNDNEFAQQFLSNVAVYSAYDKSDPSFDKSNVEGLGTEFQCPGIDKHAIFRFIDFGTNDKWGKKKVTRPVFDSWLETNCETVESAAEKAGFENVFGLNVLGPGGGQWTISANETTGLTWRRGLPTCSSYNVITIEHSISKALLNGQSGNFWKKLFAELSIREVSAEKTMANLSSQK